MVFFLQVAAVCLLILFLRFGLTQPPQWGLLLLLQLLVVQLEQQQLYTAIKQQPISDGVPNYDFQNARKT